MSPLVRFLPPLVLVALATSCPADDALQTVAERSKYTATSRHEQVLDFCERLARQSPVVRQATVGTTTQGRKIPALIVAEPALTSFAQVGESGKLVVLVTANIHAGEVDGKEAILALVRDLALAKEHPLLKNLVLVVVPNLNPDGNDRMDAKNRADDQDGPMEVGERANGQGLDLNRDFVKLESPEIRALVRLFDQCNPAAFIDMHTTNGSFHRYAITYDGPRHPAASPVLIEAAHERILPAVGEILNKSSNLRSFYYGNFSPDRKTWDTYPPLPRYSIQYAGLRGSIGLLCESYAHAPYKDRVLASRAFVQACLDYLSGNAQYVRDVLRDAGKTPASSLALRVKMTASKDPVTILGYVEERKDNRTAPVLDKPQEYRVNLVSKAEASLSTEKPFAYLFPPQFTAAIETLQRHGIEVEVLREDIELPVEALRTEKSDKAERAFQKHQLHSLTTTARKGTRRVEAGTVVVRTRQPLGNLAAFLLEPQAEDGLCAWNFFDAGVKEGKDHPVLRLIESVPLTTGKVRPLPEERKKDQPITLELFYAGKLPNLNGSPVANLTWLDDGEHFLQVKERRLYKIHAPTGTATLFVDPESLRKSLADIPGLDRKQADAVTAAPQALTMNPQRSGALVGHDNDLYFVPFGGGKVIRLTKSRGAKELAEFSPDGKYVAFVKDNNLHAVDIATQTERTLTSDGSDVIYNGKNSWVYFEEIFNRNWKAFWWSPDSSRIAFLRFDDRPVNKFTVLDHLPTRQVSEFTPYPKSGDPNPLVKLGVVAVATSKEPRFAERGSYTENAMLFSRVGWTPDSKHVYTQVQDRAQTWLDFCLMSPDGGALTCLFREKSKAWVEDLGEPRFLKDGSFLWASERTGWKHLYHYDAAGKLKKAVTSGEWEARDVHLIDETNGWIYFSGTRDSHIAGNLYRVKFDGSDLTRLTVAAGDHLVQLSPKGNLYIDTWSSRAAPPRVQLFKADGAAVRMLDTNPVHALDDYQLARPEYVQIKTPDGFVMEGTLMKPPQFDASRKYPVWFKTYGGPHAPTIRDAWWGARLEDQALAHAGFVIFRLDPRSASGKGAVATWTAYRQLGVQEMKDIEAGIKWLTQHSWVDAKRVGMSGHSYGGFMTAYAMTHSTLFAAGIAGAPVTDWHNYDSIYTERYMNTPQENPKGYEATSVVKAAAKLHGKLLIVHGIMDDNVHVQNAVQLIDALQKANKEFDMMMYPRARHPIHGKHYQKTLIEFMRRELKPS